MRLLPFKEHTDKVDLYSSMWDNFAKEQGLPSEKHTGNPRNPKELFLIEHESDIVGFAEVKVVEECFPDEDLPEICLKINAFYIEPNFRQHQLGRQAFKLLRQWGRENKAAIVEVEVNKNLDFSNDFLKEQGLELAGSGKSNIWRGFI